MQHRHARALVAAVSATAALALTLTGCSGSGSASSGGADTATLTIGTITPLTTFAAKDARFANETPYMQAVYDTLVHLDPNGDVEPWLATKWSYNDDKTVLTMQLRDDVTFSDGTKFTADVAAQNLERFRDGTSPQKAYLASLEDAKAVDDTTLELDLSSPNPSLLTFLGQNPGLVESPKAFDTKTEATTPVGSGPYVLDQKSTVVGSTYVFTKRDDYWAAGKAGTPVYDKLEMNIYQTPTAVLNAIKGGQVDAAPLSDNTTIDQVKAAGYEAHEQTLNFFGLLLFDRDGKQTPALGDVRVRQAINYAIDRPALLKAVGKGYGSVTTQVFGPDSTAYEKSLDEEYAYDPDKAKQLIAEAGYADGITITQPQSSGFPPAAYSLLQQELGDVGITVKYVQEGNATFLPNALSGKYGSMLMQLKAGPTSWETITNNLLPTSGWNALHTEDPKVQELATTVQTGSADEAAAAAKELNEYVVDRAWFAPIYLPSQTYATAPGYTVELQTGNAYPSLWNITPAK